MKKIITLVLLAAAVSSFGQDVDLAKTQLNANMLPLVVSFEAKVDHNKSITLSGGLGFAGEYTYDSYGGSSGYFYVIPVSYFSFRNYYTRRNVRKDNLKSNSGNYVGLFAQYQFAALNNPNMKFSFNGIDGKVPGSPLNNIYAIGPVWGMQRNYDSGIHLGLSLGVGVVGGEFIETTAGYIGEFEFGFVLFQNK